MIIKETSMFLLQKRWIFLLAVLSIGGALQAAPAEDFAQAKAQIKSDKAKILQVVGGLTGIAGGAVLTEYIANHFIITPHNLLDKIARLPVPKASRLPAAKYLVKEKNKLHTEAAQLLRVAALLKERREEYGQSALWKNEVAGLVKKRQSLQREIVILENILKNRYQSLNQHFLAYKASYKAWSHGRMTPALLSAQKRGAVSSSRYLLKKTERILPVLILWACLSSEVSAQEAAMARRLEQKPAMVFLLTEQEEQSIEHSQTLRRIYLQIADQIHELALLPPDEIEQLAADISQEKALEERQSVMLRQQLGRELSSYMAR